LLKDISFYNENPDSPHEDISKLTGLSIGDILAEQQNIANYPAPTKIMRSLGDYIDFTLDDNGVVKEKMIYDSGAMAVYATRVNHLAGCTSYKFIDNGTTIVFATDFEPDFGKLDERLVDWFKGADLVIADGQYEQDSKKNPFMKTWGHSDYVTDIDLCRRAGVKNLMITHHHPDLDDSYHSELEQKASMLGDKYGIEVILAKEGTRYDI
jgi:ribonuclease BN (tRNA processing enzyme)